MTAVLQEKQSAKQELSALQRALADLEQRELQDKSDKDKRQRYNTGSHLLQTHAPAGVGVCSLATVIGRNR